jgi:hypothetical protein
MTHADAAATHAVERYLLGELSTEERDRFEEHAFDCLECAEDLKAAAIFLDTSRSVLRETPVEQRATPEVAPRPKRPRGWLAWLNPASLFPSYALVPAMAVLLGLTLYQNLVTIPSLRNSSTPRALSAFSFVSSGTRGATPMSITAPAGQPFLLFFDIPPGGRYTSYHCTIVAEDGTPQLSVEVSAAQARDTVQLFVPASRLRAGRQTVVITGDAGTGATTQEIARYPFVLQQGRQ